MLWYKTLYNTFLFNMEQYVHCYVNLSSFLFTLEKYCPLRTILNHTKEILNQRCLQYQGSWGFPNLCFPSLYSSGYRLAWC